MVAPSSSRKRYLRAPSKESARSATSGQRTAAWNTAPIVGRVVPRIGPLLGIMPDDSRDIDISDLSPLVGNGDGE